MSTFKEKWENWKEGLKHRYRLIILNSDTFQEVGAYNLTLLNVYTWLSILFVTAAALVVALILFSPLGRLIPGMNTAIEKQEILALTLEVDSLQNAVRASELYARDLKAILNGTVENESQVAQQEVDFSNVKADAVPNEAEEIIREEVALEEIQQKVQGTPAQPGFVNDKRYLEQLYFTPPINGEVSSNFDPSIDHFGIDILAPKNTPIKAALNGVIIQSDWSVEFGYTIGIQHGNNLLTFYKHNSELLKKIGDQVRAGEVVAIIGNSGELSDGPHLHFELWSQGQPVDPAAYLNFN